MSIKFKRVVKVKIPFINDAKGKVAYKEFIFNALPELDMLSSFIKEQHEKFSDKPYGNILNAVQTTLEKIKELPKLDESYEIKLQDDAGTYFQGFVSVTKDTVFFVPEFD
jgi:hypothetical protein